MSLRYMSKRVITTLEDSYPEQLTVRQISIRCGTIDHIQYSSVTASLLYLKRMKKIVCIRRGIYSANGPSKL